MTDDYKDTLLKYFSGNLTKDNVTPIYYNFPQFQETTSNESTIYSYIYSNVGVGFTELGILQGYNSTYSVIYGNDSNNKGFIVILDETNTPVQFINEYNTGTAFGTFQILNVAEDGNFYGIDINNGTPRFIMLNNIVLVLPNQESFSVKLRQSYNLPSPLSTATSYFAITKAVGQGKYLIGATYLSTEYNKKSPIVTELTINVGSANEWIDYKTDYEYWDFNGNSLWASWDNDNLDFSVSGYADVGTGINYIQLIPYETNTEKILIEYNIKGISISGYSEGYYNINSLLINKNNAYIGVYDGGEYGTDELNKIYYYNGTTNELELVETFQKGTQLPFTDIDRKVQLKNINGNVFYMCKCYEKYTGVNDLYIYYGIVITDSDGDKRGISTNVVADGTTWRYDFLVSNIYNLYTYNILSLDFDNNTSVGSNYSTKQIYNPTNYNGEPYENVNSLVASTGEVYDSNNRLIFARNLYNNVVTNNTTMSVLQIPNTLLNDITLSSQSLLSQTNKILTTNQEDLVKNIYETVYYNFYNTLMIEDRNTPIFKPNMTGAVRINNSTSLTTDYDNAKATKYRLNYSDDTNLILPIQPTIQEEDSISGNNSLYITNAKEQENIISYSVDGATEQEGTPTPDNPVEVKTIPSIINYFDYKQTPPFTSTNTSTQIIDNGVRVYLTDTGSYKFAVYKVFDATNMVGKEFTLSLNSNKSGNNNYQVNIIMCDENGGNRTTIHSLSNIQNITKTFTIPTISGTSKYLALSLYATGSGSASSGDYIDYTDIQVEEGSIAHEYVPYGYWSKVKVTGKQLFKPSDYTTLTITNNGSATNVKTTDKITITTSANSANSGIYIPIANLPSYIDNYSNTTDYYISYDVVASQTLTLYTGSTTKETMEIGTTKTRITIPTKLAGSFVIYSQSRRTGDAIEVSNIMVTTTNDTTYEPYKENQVLIDMSKENLCPSTNVELGRYNVNTGEKETATTAYRNNDFVPTKPNQIYTFDTDNRKTNLLFRWFYYDNNKTLLSTDTSSTGNFTTPNDCYYVNWHSTALKDSYPNDIPNTAIYEGNNPTPYYELCKIGDYKDTLSIDSSGNCVINKNIGKVVLNGSESGWAKSGVNYVMPKTNIENANLPTGTTDLYCNYFTISSSGSPIGTLRIGSSNLVFNYDNTGDNVNGFKTWLSTHLTEVYYPLATPETINLPNTKIPLFEGINHVTFVDDLETDTSLEYDIPNVSIYTFSVLVPSDKTIDSLDILSNDELTLYHTIDTSSLENNKYYKITQNCHVE